MEKMIQHGLGTREMFLIIPSLIYFEIEHYKFSCVHRVYKMSVYTEIMMQMALFKEKYSFKRILIIFVCKCLHSDDHLLSCF